MTAVFLVAAGRRGRAGNTAECECFGVLSGRPNRGHPIAANAILFLLAVFALWTASSSAVRIAPGLLLHWATAAGLIVSVVLIALHGAAIPRRYPVPKLVVAGFDGTWQSLGDFIAGDHETFVAFVRTGCSECDRVLSAFGRLAAEGSGVATLIVLLGEADIADHALRMRLVRADESAVAHAFRLHALPSGVWVRAGRWSPSEIAEGAAAVISLREARAETGPRSTAPDARAASSGAWLRST